MIAAVGQTRVCGPSYLARDSRGFLELHGDVHQADLLRTAFAESREILSCQYELMATWVQAVPWSECLYQSAQDLT